MPTPQIQIGSDHPKGFASHIKEQIQVTKIFARIVKRDIIEDNNQI